MPRHLERGVWQATRPASLAPPPSEALTVGALGPDLANGNPVVVTHLPHGWLNDLPPADQDAIRATLGMPIRFEACDEDDRVEVSFIDARGQSHSLYLNSEFVRRVVA